MYVYTLQGGRVCGLTCLFTITLIISLSLWIRKKLAAPKSTWWSSKVFSDGVFFTLFAHFYCCSHTLNNVWNARQRPNAQIKSPGNTYVLSSLSAAPGPFKIVIFQDDAVFFLRTTSLRVFRLTLDMIAQDLQRPSSSHVQYNARVRCAEYYEFWYCNHNNYYELYIL